MSKGGKEKRREGIISYTRRWNNFNTLQKVTHGDGIISIHYRKGGNKKGGKNNGGKKGREAKGRGKRAGINVGIVLGRVNTLLHITNIPSSGRVLFCVVTMEYLHCLAGCLGHFSL
jgi:hypothetical protein